MRLYRAHASPTSPNWESSTWPGLRVIVWYVPVLAVAFSLVALPLQAQGWIELEHPSGSHRLSPPVQRVSSDIRITIDGRVARMEVEERFRNGGSAVAEGMYLYPLLGEAVFQNFSLWLGDQELRGETMNAERGMTPTSSSPASGRRGGSVT